MKALIKPLHNLFFLLFFGMFQVYAASDILYGLKPLSVEPSPEEAQLRIFNLVQGTQNGIITLPSASLAFSTTPSGSEIYVFSAFGQSGGFSVINTQTNQIIANIVDPLITPFAYTRSSQINFQTTLNQGYFPAFRASTSEVGLGILNTRTHQIIDFIPVESENHVVLTNVMSTDEKSIHLTILDFGNSIATFYHFDVLSKAYTPISLDGIDSYIPLNGISSLDSSKLYLFAIENEASPTQSKIVVLDASTQTFTTLETDALPESFQFAPNFTRTLDGKKVYTAISSSETEYIFYEIATETNALIEIPYSGAVIDMALSTDGSLVYFLEDLKVELVYMLLA